MQNRHARRLALVAGVAAGALTLASCTATTDDSPTDVQADGVAYGTSIEEWQAAFEDIDAITIVTQTQGPPGGSTGAQIEEYWASVEEWSGGKIQVDLSYSWALAGVNEAEQAIADGTIDASPFLPTFNEAAWPAFNGVNDLGYLTTPNLMLQVLHQNAWQLETTLATPEILSEFEANSHHPIWAADTVPPSILYCTSPRPTLELTTGAQTLASSSTQVIQVTAMGMQAVSLPPVEAYEALQRGVLDCVSGSVGSAVTGGNFEVAKFLHPTDQAPIISTMASMGVNLDLWESLPLVAKQLLFDRMEVYFQKKAQDLWSDLVGAVDNLVVSGGELIELDDAAQEALRAGNEELAEKVRSATAYDGEALIERAEASAAKWDELITDTLGFPDDVALLEIGDWLEDNASEIPGMLQDWTDLMFDDFLIDHRPAA